MTRTHREVETKYDVDVVAVLPDLAGLPDVARVEGPVSHHLEATYFDTADLALGSHGITLRVRTGGDDPGWHLKLPVDGARQEIQATPGRSTRTPPAALRRIVRGVVRARPLAPVATVVTERSVTTLRAADETLLAIVCDDHVAGTTSRPTGDTEVSWREWEVERHEARGRLVKALDRRVRDAGARAGTQGSKLGRVVGLDSGRATVATRTPRERATDHELLGQQLAHLTAELHRLDPLARADVPDAVHQLRTLCRRLRGILISFDSAFDATTTGPVSVELDWIGDLLGRPRDLEVLRERLSAMVVAEPPHLVRGRPGQWIDSQLRAEHRSAHRDAVDAMTSARYFALVDTLDSWRGGPPWADQRPRSAHKRLAPALDREWARLERAAASVASAGEADRLGRLHDVRKAAKRARFAAETLMPVLGPEARTMARTATRIQDVLGALHDSVVAADRLLDLSDAARAAGRDTFTYGVLHVRLEAEVAEHASRFDRLWRKVRRLRARTGKR